MNARRGKSGSSTQRSLADRGSRPLGERLALVGVVVATFGVAITMLPGGYNPFGPAKVLVLLVGTTCVAAGFALAPGLAIAAGRRALAQRGTWPAMALVGLAFLATLTSIDPSQSFVGHYPEYQGLALLLASAVVGFGAYALAARDRLWRVLGMAAVVAVLVVATYSAVQFVGLDPVAWARALVVRRVQSTLGNASNLGVFLCLALPLVLARARAERGAWRWLAWLALASGALTLALSLSRGAWVAALAGAAVWTLAEGRAWDRRTRVRAVSIALASAVAAVALTAALVPTASTRLAGLLDPSSGTPGWRAEVWTATTHLVAQRPLLGFGPASFRYAFPPIRTAAMQVGETGVQELDDPHNLLASAAVSAGVFALAALAWLLGEALLAGWRLNPNDRWHRAGPALAASVAGGVVALQFHFATLDSAPLLAVLIALALGRGALAPEAPRAAEPAAATPRTRALWPTRIAAGTIATFLVAVVLLAAGLTLADRQLATGFALVSAGRPWSEAKARFESAQSLAPWEPAMQWALGQGATREMSGSGSTDAFPDAQKAMTAAMRRLPLDPLVVAQTADVYLVGGLASRDIAKVQAALPLIERGIAMDPENGYRWAAKATALAALGQTDPAIEAFNRAVQYAPNDVQAWSGLASMYERTGQNDRAAEANRRAAALRQNATAPSP